MVKVTWIEEVEVLTLHHGAKKTEHTDPKKGRSAYWGRKADAKNQSNRNRREQDKMLLK